jgi:regulator of protease activity HflC (stomatin/prohibitin superfamily)
MNPSSILALIFLVLTAMIVIKGVRIVRQSESMVIERLGKYRTTLNAGINIIIPIVDRPRDIVWRMSGELPDGSRVTKYKMRDRVDLRETVFDFPKQGVITKDNVVTEINALIYFKSPTLSRRCMKSTTFPMPLKSSRRRRFEMSLASWNWTSA